MGLFSVSRGKVVVVDLFGCRRLSVVDVDATSLDKPPFDASVSRHGQDRLMDLETGRIDTSAELAALEPQWRALLADSCQDGIFLTWEWISLWLDGTPPGVRPAVLTVRDRADGRLLAIAPLSLRRRGIYRELSFMGAGDASGDHLDVIVRRGFEEEVRPTLLEAIAGLRCDLLRLEGLRADSPVAERFGKPADWRGHHLSSMVCPFVRLPGSWQEFEQSLPRRMRYNLRSRLRRLERAAGGKVESVTAASEEEARQAIELLFELKRRAWSTQRGPERFLTARKMEFHRQIARRFARRGWLRLHLLKAGDAPIAASYCFSYGGTVSFFQTAFDRAWSRYGPGAAIVAASIRSAIEEGAHEFDFLRGDESYKFDWTGDSRRVLKLRAGVTTIGELAITGYRLARGARDRIRGYGLTGG
jgi:CelD/BcsL family acetyltransferase involved in cellulose biosynthesis